MIVYGIIEKPLEKSQESEQYEVFVEGVSPGNFFCSVMNRWKTSAVWNPIEFWNSTRRKFYS